MADCIRYNSDYINFKIFLINMQYFFQIISKGKLERMRRQSTLHRVGKHKSIEQAYTLRFIDMDAQHFPSA